MAAKIDLLDPGSPGVDSALLRILADASRTRAAIVFGGPEAERQARSAGVRVLGRIAAPRRPGDGAIGGWLAGRALRRGLRAFENTIQGPLVTWSEPMLSAALMAGIPAERLEAKVVAVSGPSEVVPMWSRLFGATPRDEVAVQGIGLALGSVLARRGWFVGESIDPDSVPVGLGAESARPIDFDAGRLVVGVVSSPPEALDLREVVTSAATLVAAGHRVDLVVSPDLHRLSAEAAWLVESERMIRGGEVSMRIDHRIDDPGVLADELDVVVVPSPRRAWHVPSVLTLRAWLAAGVPAVAARDRSASDLVQDGVDARLYPSGDRNALARILARLASDPRLRSEMGHAAAARHGHRVRKVIAGSSDQSSGSFDDRPRAASW